MTPGSVPVLRRTSGISQQRVSRDIPVWRLAHGIPVGSNAEQFVNDPHHAQRIVHLLRSNPLRIQNPHDLAGLTERITIRSLFFSHQPSHFTSQLREILHPTTSGGSGKFIQCVTGGANGIP
jgi:hypothetical protein